MTSGGGSSSRPRRVARLVTVGAVLGALLSSLLGAVPASAAVAPAVAALPSVPLVAPRPDGVFELQGRGYGHGRGMSQWGAQGAALRGLTHQQILAFYYAGTTLSTVARGNVRVQLSGLPGEAVVEASADVVLRDVASGRTLTWGSRGSRLRLAPAADGLLRLQAWNGTQWVAVNVTGWSGAITGPVVVSGPSALRIRESSTVWREYRGSLTVHRGPFEVVNTLPTEQYLYSVVPSESPAYFQPAALRAQAVAARSYAAAACNGGSSRYDQRDTVQCQVYRGRAVIRSGTRTSIEQASTTAAVDATREVVVRRAGATLRTEFSASNGGWTAASTNNPAKQDPYDGVDPRNTNHTWSTTVTAAQAARAWPAVGTVRDITVLARTGDGQWGGRATSVRVTGSTGSVTVTGDQFRTAMGLRSTWFTFVVRNLPVADDLLVTAGSRGVGSVEVLSFTAASGFTQRRTLTRTGVPEKSPRDWRFFYGSSAAGWRPDLVAVHANNTASGFVEVEVWSWASGYTVKTLDVVTPHPQFDPMGFTHVTTWERADGSTDLAFFRTDRTDTTRVSMDVLSAASRYRSYSVRTLTGMTGRDDATSGQYLMTRSGDVFQLRTRGTASGKTEVRVFRQSSSWAASHLTVATGVNWVDSTKFRFVLRDYDRDGLGDLVGVHIGRSTGPRIQVLPRRDGFLVQRYIRDMVGMPVATHPFWQTFAR